MENSGMYMDADDVAAYVGCKKYYAYRLIREVNMRMKSEYPNSLVVRGKVNRKYFIRCTDPVAAEKYETGKN